MSSMSGVFARPVPACAPRSYRSLIAFVFALVVTLPPRLSAAVPAPVQQALDRFDLSADDVSILVQEVGTGRTVLSHRPDVPRNPASTMKLVTTYASLASLTPGYVWPTEVLLDGDLDAQGVLHGDLVLRGGGDPYLVEEQLWQLLGEIYRRGVHRITGNILLDGSFFSLPEEDPGAFDGEPLRAYNVAPNALLLNFKVIRFFFAPDPESGRVRITHQPPLANLSIDNRIRLVPGRCRGYQRGIEIDAVANGDEVRFAGSFPSGCRQFALSRSLLTHTEYAAGLFERLWYQLGGRLDGTIREGVAEDEVPVWFTWRSRPFGELVRLINKHSNNVMTRQVFLTLGAEQFGPPASLPKAREAVLAWLDAEGLSADAFRIDNGSGLSRNARATATSLASLLQHAWRSPYMPEFVASLSIVGIDGTFGRRHREGPLTGTAHLKTGRLDDVTAMAGYVQAADGRRYVAVLLHNAPDVHRGTGVVVQDALLGWLHAYRLPVQAAPSVPVGAAGETP